MQDRGFLLSLLTGALLTACSFDGGGVSDDIDAGGGPDDGDGDGIVDDDDNCPDDANADQRDEDGDGVGNACDNCPHVDNADQTNAGETAAGAAQDDAGDACDPDPTGAGNDLLLFDGFDDPASLDDWRTFLGGNWSISGGALRETSATGLHTIYLASRQFSDAALDVGVTLDAVAASTGPSDASRGLGTLMTFAPAAGEGVGYLCLLYMNAAEPAFPPTGTYNLFNLRGAQPAEVEVDAPLNTNLEAGERYELRQTLDTGTGGGGCGVRSSALPAPVEIGATDPTHSSGFVGLRTNSVTARFEYVAVYALPTGN